MNFDCENPINMTILTIHPSKKIILDDSLKFNQIKINPIQENFMINLKNFYGFELSTNPFKNIDLINYETGYLVFIIGYSKLNFIFEKTLISDKCDLNLMGQSDWSNYLFKGHFTIIENTNIFSKNTCPLAFQNSFLYKLSIEGISSSLFKKNEFEFIRLNHTDDINSYISVLNLVMYRTSLTDKLLNEHVFKNLFSIELNGFVDSIQDDLFKNFKNLKLLFIRMQYIKNIFMKNNKWLNYLNYDQFFNRTKVVSFNQTCFLVLYQTLPRVTLYQYPDEDFCYFKNFPHDKLVMPVLKPNHNTNCSCTELFLIHYSYFLKDRFDANFKMLNSFNYQFALYYTDILAQETFQDCLNDDSNESIRRRIIKCNFKKRLKLCETEFSIENENNSDKSYFTIEDWEVLSKQTHLYIFITNQIVSLICIFFNILTILIISKKPKKLEAEKTYKYLRIYTVLNCFYLLILYTKFICFKDIFHCYTTKNLVYIQYFKLISVRLVGNTLKTASNITYVSFTLSRYIMVTNYDLKLFKIFQKLSLKFYFLLLGLFSISVNGYVYFVSPTKDASLMYSGNSDISKNITDLYKWESIGDYKQNFENSNFQLFNSLQIIRIIFSDILYVILVFIIDYYLLKFVTKQMKNKIANLIQNGLNQFGREIKLKRQAKNTEKRITSLIVLNGINFFVFKLPATLMSLYGFIFIYDQTNNIYKPNLIGYIICRHLKFCESIAELAHLFYLLSFIAQFFIFFKLDKNFNDNFSLLILRLKNKIRPRNLEILRSSSFEISRRRQ